MNLSVIKNIGYSIINRSDGCTQAALEANGEEYCVVGFDEERKTKIIKNKFEELCSEIS